MSDPGGQGHARHPARRGRGLAPDRGRGARPLRALRLPRDPHAGLRGDGALRARHRRGDRHRLEGDVHLRRPRRRLADAAARGHRRDRARRDRAQPASNTDPALKVYAIGPMFRRERPQKGRYRQFHQVDVEAFGFTSPTIDAEMIELALAYLDACGVGGARAGAELGGRPPLPAGLRREAARGAAREAPPSLCARLPAAGRDEPAARPRLQGARGPGGDRGPAEDHRPPVRRVPRRTSPRCAGSSTLLGIPYRLTTAWCAASTTTCARPSR